MVERVEKEAAWVHQDLRDTDCDWFYWCFRVEREQEEKVCFHFTQSVAIGSRGPAVSVDGGATWQWLGAGSVEENSFSFTFPSGVSTVFFGMTIPYTGRNWKTFLSQTGDSPFLEQGTLCLSSHGMPVEKLSVGCLPILSAHRVLLIARQHSCESMASFCLEGLVTFILRDTEDGDWLRRHVEFLVIPFMDKEGVEAGDQGKRRRPHDHNRDYNEVSIYRETAALRAMIPGWSAGRLRLALDLHCPWLKGDNSNESVYLVGSRDPAHWNEQERFSRILEEVKTGLLPFFRENNIPFGSKWNTDEGYAQGTTFTRWVSKLKELSLASAIEVPYANAHGVEVNARSAREFGADLGRAIAGYLRSEPSARP